jgi:hypothetical protein
MSSIAQACDTARCPAVPRWHSGRVSSACRRGWAQWAVLVQHAIQAALCQCGIGLSSACRSRHSDTACANVAPAQVGAPLPSWLGSMCGASSVYDTGAPIGAPRLRVPLPPWLGSMEHAIQGKPSANGRGFSLACRCRRGWACDTAPATLAEARVRSACLGHRDAEPAGRAALSSMVFGCAGVASAWAGLPSVTYML